MVKTERFLSKRESLAKNYKVDITRGGESAIYSGRAVAALASSGRGHLLHASLVLTSAFFPRQQIPGKGMLRKTGQVLNVGDLAREFGFTDIDGRQPAQMFTLRFLVENAYYYLLYRLRGPRQD